MTDVKVLTQEEYQANRKAQNLTIDKPEWWKQTHLFQVQMLEGNVWVVKMSSNAEYADDFRTLARNPYCRILKNGVDITSKYRTGAVAAPVVAAYGATSPLTPGPIQAPQVNDKPMRPAEYKALSGVDKVKMWKQVEQLLDRKAKRAEIFAELNISEATYDVIRLEMKEALPAKDQPVAAPKIEETAKPSESKVTASPAFTGKLQRPSLLRR